VRGGDRAHVIDDSFVQPEPGTAAGDHLVTSAP
jgi:hypothetical protein